MFPCCIGGLGSLAIPSSEGLFNSQGVVEGLMGEIIDTFDMATTYSVIMGKDVL